MVNSPNIDVLLDVNSEQNTSVIQDPIHIATKLRNRMLKASIVMPMGKKQVSISHIKILIHNVPKDTHGLVASDIIPEDRQNYGSFVKMTAPRVLSALESHVIDSEATVMYLRICIQITSAFTEIDLSPLDRIHLIWHSLYFIRAWRKWIESIEKYSLDKNFLSTNAFTCIELNAYGILHLIVKFRKMDAPELFLTAFFQSQTCEQLFRQLRSMTSINWTKINFSLLEVLNQIGRIELQHNILFEKLANKDVSFPRAQNRSNKFKIYSLPSDDEIRNVLSNAQDQALKDALKLGIDVNAVDITLCKIKRIEIREKTNDKKNNTNIDSTVEKTDDLLACSNVRDYSHREGNIESDNRYIDVIDETGTSKTILKSSLVWLLSDTKGVLSNDRLRRVQLPTTASCRKRKRDVPISFRNNENTSMEVQHLDEIRVGDWCYFHSNSSMQQLNVQELQYDDIVYGLVVGFRYIDGKTDKDHQYTLDYVPVSYEGINKRGIEVLATWYRYKRENNQILVPSSPENSYFIDLINYIASTCAPIVEIGSNNNESCYKLHKNFIEMKELLINCGN